MPAKRLPMHRIRQILRLHFDVQLSRRQIARSLSVSRDTVASTLDRAEAATLIWEEIQGLSDSALEIRLYGTSEPPQGHRRPGRPEPNFELISKELARPHVTLRQLWREYIEVHPDGLRYSWYCERYRQWKKHTDAVMHLEHKAGEKLFVDWAGDTIGVVDAKTGELRDAHLFVAVLGCSNYTYIEATWTEKLEDWIGAHVRALRFLEGSPRLIIPDNTKTAVKKACRYTPKLNRTYEKMAAHYGTAILPARVRKPRDKAPVEAGVLHAERQIIGGLRNRTFFSLAELNDAIAEVRDEINEARFQKMEGSRKSRFEQLEKPALRPLPSKDYVFVKWRVNTPGPNYHIKVKDHFYSVPFRLIGRTLDVCYNDHIVEVYDQEDRVASHQRSFRKGGYTTVADHMPSNHRHHAEWTPKRITRWAATVGENTRKVCEEILQSGECPEQGFSACMGIIKLAQQHGADRTDAACDRALKIGSPRYRSIKSILKRGLESAPLFESDARASLGEHEHIRGPEYYN